MRLSFHSMPPVSPQIWAGALGFSLLIHTAATFSFRDKITQEPVKFGKLQVQVKAPPASEVKPEPKKPKPEKKELRPTPNQRVDNAKPEAPPQQGLTKDSVADKGTISAPVGNTLMKEDDGTRLRPDQVNPLAGDRSAAASLIRSSVTIPPYTEGALDATLEGSWMVDVYVDISGKVTQADLQKKIGYGMDERVLEAARNARFNPRLNKYGAPEAGWAEIKFTLVLP